MRRRNKKLRGPAETCRPKNVPTSLWSPTGFEPGFYHFQPQHLTHCASGWLPASFRFPSSLIPHLSPPPPLPFSHSSPPATLFYNSQLSLPFSPVLQRLLQHHHLCKPIRTFLNRYLNLTWLLTRSQFFSIFNTIFWISFRKALSCSLFLPHIFPRTPPPL